MSALSVDPDKVGSAAILRLKTGVANLATNRVLETLPHLLRVGVQESGITQPKPCRAFYGMTADVVHKFACLSDYFYKNK